MNITTIIGKDTSLPYKVQIDKLQGIGNCPASAVMAALSVGKKIPSGMRDGVKAVEYIKANYEIDKEWIRLINIIESNTFNFYF